MSIKGFIYCLLLLWNSYLLWQEILLLVFQSKLLSIFVYISGPIEPITLIWAPLKRSFEYTWWVYIMPTLVKGDDVTRGTRTKAHHGWSQTASESMVKHLSGIRIGCIKTILLKRFLYVITKSAALMFSRRKKLPDNFAYLQTLLKFTLVRGCTKSLTGIKRARERSSECPIHTMNL